MPLAQRLVHFLYIKWPLRNQNDVSAPGNPAVESNPARIAAHHLDHDHTVMWLGRGVQPVNRFADPVARGVETKRKVGPAQVIVDGFWHTHHVDGILMQLLCRGKCGVAADGDQSFNMMLFQSRQATLDSIRTLGRIRPRGPQNRPSAGQNAAHSIEAEVHTLVSRQAAPTLQKADELIVIMKHTLAHHSANHRIESGTIASAGQHANLHISLLSRMNWFT